MIGTRWGRPRASAVARRATRRRGEAPRAPRSAVTRRRARRSPPPSARARLRRCCGRRTAASAGRDARRRRATRSSSRASAGMEDVSLDRALGAGLQLRHALEEALVAGRSWAASRRRTRARDRGPSGRGRRSSTGGCGRCSRLGVRPDPLERDVLAGVAGLLLRPDRLHRLDALAHQRHPRARVGAVVAHLLAVPAGADAELAGARPRGGRCSRPPSR